MDVWLVCSAMLFAFHEALQPDIHIQYSTICVSRFWVVLIVRLMLPSTSASA